MFELRPRIGSVTVQVITDLPAVGSILEHALGSEDGGPPPGARLTIRHHPAAYAPIDDPQEPASQVYRFENGVTYTYDPGNLVYNIRAGTDIRGVIRFTDSIVAWDVRQSLLPRSALHLLVLDPLSLLLPGKKVMVCHGAAVVGRQGAALLFGRSGYGKSTLGFLLSHEEPAGNIRFLSDDTMILDFSREDIHVCPVHSGFGLTHDLLQRFGMSAPDEAILQRSRGKLYLSHLPHQTTGAHKIHRVVFLEKRSVTDDRTEVLWLDRGKTLELLLSSQTSIPSPYMIDRLVMYQRLVAQAPGVCLRFADYCDVDRLRMALR